MAKSRKALVMVIDGLGDLPHADLDGCTPLEAAETPAMNRLAGAGQYCLVDPIAPGIVPNTHSGTGLLMGMIPDQERLLSRGPVEAAGAGVDLQEGDIAFRANFATMERGPDGLKVLDRRAGRISENTDELAAALDGLDLGDGISVRIQSTDQHRLVLVLRGHGLDANISNTDPGDQAMPADVLTCKAGDNVAFFSASKLQKFVERAHEILDRHPINEARRQQGLLPANGILTRGAGAAFRLDSTPAQNALSAAVVAGCNTVLGMASLFGFEPVTGPSFSADTLTDVDGKLKKAVDTLARHSLVFIHFKAPDILAHDLNPQGKRDFIQKIDRAMEQLGLPEFAVLVTADHSTDSNTGAHTADPVPVLFYRPDQRTEGKELNFSERACSTGNHQRSSGFNMMNEVIQFMV